jgi:deoxyribonuclease-4
MKQLSNEFDITVSVHASYFIVFTSAEKKKIEQSTDTLKRTYELADLMGAGTVVLHPGALYAKEPGELVKRIKENLNNYFKDTGSSDIGLFLETAGKRGQLGSVEEIFDICAAVKGCFPCIDFGHVHARTGGTLDNEAAIDNLFEKLDDFAAFKKPGRIHFHYTPIHYGPKGEIKHKAIEDIYENEQLTDARPGSLYHPRYKRIVENLVLRIASCTVISETHNSQERGALAMKSIYNNNF